MINSIGIKNFRSLKELKIDGRNCIELKPITLLLGKNSSGKSSFLRVFPLLKQSVTSRTRGALALFGDEVDFGDFATTISSDAEFDEKGPYIEFHFTGEILPKNHNLIYSSNQENESLKKDVKKTDISYKIRSNDSLEILYVSDFQMQVDADSYSFSIDSNYKLESFKVNNRDFVEELKSVSVIQSGFYSCFPFFDDRKMAFLVQLNSFVARNFQTAVANESMDLFRWSNLSDIDSREKLNRIILSNKKSSYYFRNEKLCQVLKELSYEEKIMSEFYDRIQLFRFNFVYTLIITDLIENFSSVSYSKPLRANADRYYRSRSLTSDEINSDGSNLVDFYICLGEEKQKEMQYWMLENFGFFYTIESSQGHKSIYIHEGKLKENTKIIEEETKHNITDMGFGFSQILPIATQIWHLQKVNYRRIGSFVNYIYAIEQPELHLHPAMQCKLIKTLAKIPKIAAKQNVKLSFLVETHSETIINQFGRLIDQGSFSSEDISVLIFSKEKPFNYTKIQQSNFNRYGELTEWPIGFFGEDA